VQYVSIKYTERLAEAGIEPSVGSIGDSYDNACQRAPKFPQKWAVKIPRFGGGVWVGDQP
jgi:hypothetical protein